MAGDISSALFRSPLRFRTSVEYFRDAVFNYPTLAETYKVAALDGLNRIPKVNCKDFRRGATMAEFALFFLLFLMLAVGMMELGRGIWTYITLAHAARQGARYAVVHGLANPIAGDDPSIEAIVKANAVGLDGSEISVLTIWDPANEPGSVVEVQVQYPFRLAVAPLIMAQDSIQMGSTSRMIMAN